MKLEVSRQDNPDDITMMRWGSFCCAWQHFLPVNKTSYFICSELLLIWKCINSWIFCNRHKMHQHTWNMYILSETMSQARSQSAAAVEQRCIKESDLCSCSSVLLIGVGMLFSELMSPCYEGTYCAVWEQLLFSPHKQNRCCGCQGSVCKLHGP